MSVSSCLDLDFLLLNDYFYLLGNAKGLKKLFFINSCFDKFLLPHLLNVFLVHWRNWHVPLDVHFIFLEIDNTEVLLSCIEGAFIDDGLLEYMEDLVFPKKFVTRVA